MQQHADGGNSARDDRTARIRRDWEHITAHGGSMLLTALAGISPNVPVLLALLQANMVSASSLTLEQDRGYRQALAEVYSVPDPAKILFDDVAQRLRPALARAMARRREHEEPTLADYAAADLQLLISEQWAHGMHRHGFRCSSADVIRSIAADWSGDGPSVPWWLDAGDHLRDVRERSTEYWRRRWQQIKQRQRIGDRHPQNAGKFGHIATNAIPGGMATVAISRPMLMQEKTIDAVIFGRNMKRGRDLKGMSQTDLANELGLKQPDISRYEQGDRYPRSQRRREIARILEQPPIFFLDESVLREDERW